jgi:hypothetical protein
MADGKRSKAQWARKTTRFTPGTSGVCEAQLWEFSGPSRFGSGDEETSLERIAAASLDDALKFMRRRYPDFTIVKAVTKGMIAILSGSPLE